MQIQTGCRAFVSKTIQVSCFKSCIDHTCSVSWRSLDPVIKNLVLSKVGTLKGNLYRVHCVLILKAFLMLLPTLGHGFFSGMVNALLDFVHLTGTDRFSSVFLKPYYFF